MIDFDDVLRALFDGSRRELLLALREAEPVYPFSAERTGKDRAIRLHQLHLPFLEDDDLVAWNRATGAVRRGDNFEAVEPVLTALDTRRGALPDDYRPIDGPIC